jgi:hypothetical protein
MPQRRKLAFAVVLEDEPGELVSFTAPPLAEVVCSVQFNDLPLLTVRYEAHPFVSTPAPARHLMRKCKAKNRDKTPCRMKSLQTGDFCFINDAQTREHRDAARALGGAARKEQLTRLTEH